MSAKRKNRSDSDKDESLSQKKQRVEDDNTPLSFYSKSKDHNSRELSNFAASPILVDGRWFPTVEHVYQAKKFEVAGSKAISLEFSTIEENGIPVVGATGLDAKKAGGKGVMKARKLVLPIDVWDKDYRTPIMLKALQAKFKIPKFRAILKATGSRPLHHHERRPGFWGTHVNKASGETKGENMLGRMLEGFRKINNIKDAKDDE